MQDWAPLHMYASCMNMCDSIHHGRFRYHPSVPGVPVIPVESLSFGAAESSANVVFTVKATTNGRSLLDDPQTTTRFNARLGWKRPCSLLGLSFLETTLGVETRKNHKKTSEDSLRLGAGAKRAHVRLFYRDGNELPSYDPKHRIEFWVTAPVNLGVR